MWPRVRVVRCPSQPRLVSAVYLLVCDFVAVGASGHPVGACTRFLHHFLPNIRSKRFCDKALDGQVNPSQHRRCSTSHWLGGQGDELALCKGDSHSDSPQVTGCPLLRLCIMGLIELKFRHLSVWRTEGGDARCPVALLAHRVEWCR